MFDRRKGKSILILFGVAAIAQAVMYGVWYLRKKKNKSRNTKKLNRSMWRWLIMTWLLIFLILSVMPIIDDWIDEALSFVLLGSMTYIITTFLQFRLCRPY